MIPTNPAAPPAAPVLEHPAMVARRVSVPGVSYDEGGRMIESYAQARVDAATRGLRQALEVARDYVVSEANINRVTGNNDLAEANERELAMIDAALEGTAPR